MSKASSIDSLEKLHARQAQVKQQKEAAKKGLVKSLAQTPGKVKQFAYEDLALPVMGIGLAVYIGYRLLRSDRPKESFSQAVLEPQLPPAVDVPESPRVRYNAPAVLEPHLPPAVAMPENPRVRYNAPAKTPRSVSFPRPEMPVTSSGKSVLNFAAIISAGKLLIPAAQAIMSAVQDHKAQQAKRE